KKIGLPTSPPYLSLIGATPPTTGISFASGGSGILTGTGASFVQYISLAQEVEYFSLVHNKLVRQLGQSNAHMHLSKSIFIIVIESNDMFSYFNVGSLVSKQYTPQQYVDLMVSTFKDVVWIGCAENGGDWSWGYWLLPGSKIDEQNGYQRVVKGLAECKASASNLRHIQVKDIVNEVEDHLKTYSSAEMYISWLFELKPVLSTESVKVVRSWQNCSLKGWSHVINVHEFDKEDFTSWKVRFLIFFDGLEPYLLKTLEFVPMSSLSTSDNPLPKCQNQWSNAESCLVNQDKRLKTHEGPSDIRDTKIAALRLKFNDFKSLKGENVNGTFTRLKCLLNDLENNGVIIPQADVNDSGSVEVDQRTSNEFMADLNAEYHERALLANQKRFYKRGRDNMVIAEDEPSVGKADARSSKWVNITMKKALGGRGKRKEKISSKEIIFTKADESSPMSIPEITSDSESKCETLKPLPPILKLIGSAPAGTLDSLISLADLTLNMVDLALNTSVLKKTKPTSVNVSSTYVIKKKIENKSLAISESCSDKKADSSTKQLLLTLMEEVKGLKSK
nr:GDSL esterase/lipase At5g55050-like [Tanacetum cinerariifolium]